MFTWYQSIAVAALMYAAWSYGYRCGRHVGVLIGRFQAKREMSEH